jgi:tripartite-type tricarboxylate transporter receptor subunit TctC
MALSFKQPVVVDNRAGASGAIAADAVAKAEPDGYTLLACTSSTQVMLPLVNKKLTFDPQKDLIPAGVISKAENTLVVPASSPFKTVVDLIAYAKANPGKLTYGTAGVGPTHHLAAELLQSQGGFEAVHVPYKGTPLAESDLVAGRLDFMLNNTAPALPNIKGGKTRALMVTGATRSPELPSTPTSKEAGLADFEVYGFTGLCAPARTPRAVVERISAELSKAVAQPDVRQKLLQLGFDGKPMSPEKQGAYIRTESERWTQVIQRKGLKFE